LVPAPEWRRGTAAKNKRLTTHVNLRATFSFSHESVVFTAEADMTQTLKIEDGPDNADLHRVAAIATPSLVRFDVGTELCDLRVVEMDAVGGTGTCWRIKGAFRSGNRKGRRFTGSYNASTKKGLLDVATGKGASFPGETIWPPKQGRSAWLVFGQEQTEWREVPAEVR
jgi:hypothetical protein